LNRYSKTPHDAAENAYKHGAVDESFEFGTGVLYASAPRMGSTALSSCAVSGAAADVRDHRVCSATTGVDAWI
jgi:hypothetical protein